MGLFMEIFVHFEWTFKMYKFKQINCNIKILNFKTYQKLFRLLITRKLYSLYIDHCKLSIHVMLMYQQLWSNVLTTFLLISIPLNVVANMAIILRQLKWFDLLIVYLISAMNSIIMIMTMLKAARLTQEMHKPENHLVPIVQFLKRANQFRLKLRCDEWYHIMTSGKFYGPYISSLGPITYKLALQV